MGLLRLPLFAQGYGAEWPDKAKPPALPSMRHGPGAAHDGSAWGVRL